MEQQQQLSVIDFGDLNIQIYGTILEPLIKCSDLLIHVLGYSQCSQANWFKQLKNDHYYVTTVNHNGTQFFTEQGVYKALMKSNKPIAELFQKRVCDLLTKMRIQQYQENQRLKQEIEELKQSRECSVYKIYNAKTNELLYIGKDASIAQNRCNQHIAERKKILQAGFQQIDIHLATIQLEDIRIETIICNDQDVNVIEQTLIEKLNPPFNQVFNQQIMYQCNKCLKSYQYRACYEKHILSHQ